MRADWYDHPSWYDILHTPGTAREVSGLRRIARRFVGPQARRWLEPACGSGRYLRLAAARGILVEGFDLNPAMIQYARNCMRRRGLPGAIRVADMCDFTATRPADLIFCPINSIRHLPSDRAMLAHLRCARAALAPKGVYALGMETALYRGSFPSEDVWVGVRGRVCVRQLVQYLPPTKASRVERVISHLSIHTPAQTRTLESTYDLRAYDHAQWTDLLRRAGWKAVGICDADGRDALLTRRGHVVGGYALWVIRPE